MSDSNLVNDDFDPKSIKLGRKLISDKSQTGTFLDYARKALFKLELSQDKVIV